MNDSMVQRQANAYRIPTMRHGIGTRLLLLLLLLLCVLTCSSQAFLLVARTGPVGSSLRTLASKTKDTTTNTVQVRTYSYKDWKVNYRYKPAAPGQERDPPLLLIHPVGIGLSSWFWENFMDEWQGGPVYAPDLLGCGSMEVWDFEKGDLSSSASSFPDRWVEACEVVLALHNPQTSSLPSWLSGWWNDSSSSSSSSSTRPNGWTVVAQGGLAPVGVRIAHRNPSQISHLVLTSPPTWSDMTTAIPAKELQRNYQFLRSPVWGAWAFRLLETRWAVSFFSNLFLFASNHVKETTKWLDQVQAGIGNDQRFPVMAFNAGFCQQVSYETELMELQQPTLILQGQEDTARKREEYAQTMNDCQIQTIPGKNVLPWESPVSVCDAIRGFL